MIKTLTAVALLCVMTGTVPTVAAEGTYEYLVLATTRTSTLEREMNEAAEAGYRFQGVMGGDTAIGGSEVVAIMMRGSSSTGRFAYRLLATNRTSTMQEEMQEAGNEGYDYRGQTVFESFFGGEEVVVIMELDNDASPARCDFPNLDTAGGTDRGRATRVRARGSDRRADSVRRRRGRRDHAPGTTAVGEASDVGGCDGSRHPQMSRLMPRTDDRVRTIVRLAREWDAAHRRPPSAMPPLVEPDSAGP